MLQIEHISKQYKTGDFVQRALNDVSLNLRDNEFVAILGPSGSGKTTLLNIIGGLDHYDSGDLIINGISTKKYQSRDWDAYRNHSIGFVFQSYNLIPHQSILSNVELALTISGVGPFERKRRAKEALQQVGLGDHINKKPNQLSGGQMQRVAIARALVNNPSIVLADEPTGALDSETSVQIMDLLKEVAKDRLVVMVTHNPDLAKQYATRIVELRDGVIQSDSDPYTPQAEGEEVAAPVHKSMGKASMGFLTSLGLSLNNLMTKKGRTILTAFAGSIGIIGIALIMSVSSGVNRYISDIQRDTMTAYPITIEKKTFDLSSLMSDAQTSGTSSDDDESKKHDENAIYPDDTAIKQTSTMTSSVTENNLTKFKKYLDDKSSEIHQYVGDAGIQYSYDTKFSVFTHDTTGALVNVDGVDVESSDSSSSMASQLASGSLTSLNTSTITSTRMSMLTGETDTNAAPSAFQEILPGSSDGETISQVISDNYKVVNGSWPKAKDEVVLILDENNTLPLTTVYELGLLPASDYRTMMNQLNSGEDVKTNTDKIDYSKALGQQFSLLPAYSQYVKNSDGHYKYVGDDAEEVASLIKSDQAVQLKVVGVVKPIDDAKATPLSTGVGYTRDLTNYLIDAADSSQIVKDQQADKDHSVLNGMTFSPSDDAGKAADMKTYVESLSTSEKASMAKNLMTATGQSAETLAQMSEQQLANQFDAYIASADQSTLVTMYNQYVSTGSYDDNLSAFGLVSRDAPKSINIYVNSFEDKNSIVKAIDNYNKSADKDDKITYTDYIGLMMNSVTTIINVISYVLIAFVAVALVVSSIMIGIITYISVLERTKEIGILRAMGASKRNVSNVFNAETVIIGLFAGLLGIGITLLLLIPINSILHAAMGTNEVTAYLPIPNAIALVILSVLLTFIGGLIPSKGAAKKDPATALRTE